ncbi:dihydroxyacetone kinase family protein [Jiangella muralis]|uniref:dihydroxyacetone kinase family protein n=1 Tax=Jiangella muralis TaxID=702383 RepID=UPI00069E5830|nr:dihydroxyacetone kinase family protein [Jiangella muralis]
MTAIHNGAGTFVDEALEGLTLAYGRDVRRVDGGVVRVAARPAGHVGVVLGGGSGHYPAFAGLVGPGLAAGAVCGQVFTSPSAAQAYRVCHAVDAGAGVLLVYGNYAGDVLHFGIAQRRLRAEGHDVRTVLVTDDVASAPAAERERRRGIAGDFVVVKIAGAAAETGADLDSVERVARKANERTRTLGVAISGCTLPGAGQPLFEVPAGVMSVGLGIHGEPGIEDRPLASSREIAALLVDALLAERAGDGARLAVVVNGLGTVTYEELFVLFKDVAGLLSERGIEVVEPEVGELVTSLDMGGVSLTVCWLDDELERLWRAPAASPAFVKTERAAAGDAVPDVGRWSDATVRLPRPPTPELMAAADDVVAALAVVCSTLEEHESALARLDAVAGDGDHGSGMVRGARAALAAATAAAGGDQAADAVLVAAGRAWAEHGAGTSGALWGAGLEAAGLVVNAAGTLDTGTGTDAVTAALAAISELGGARAGDKTMVDAMEPFVAVLTGTGAWRQAAAAAREAAAATAGLRPRLGRARPLAEKSLGHPDPGATSFALLAAAITQHLTERPAR